MITKKKVIPSRSLVYGMPAKVVRELSQEEVDGVQSEVKLYADLGAEYKKLQGE